MPKRSPNPIEPERTTVADARRSADESLPEWVPLPHGKDTEFYSGMKRGMLNQLILPNATNHYRPIVVSVSLRRPGQRKGKRLVLLTSLLGYLRKLQQQQHPSS